MAVKNELSTEFLKNEILFGGEGTGADSEQAAGPGEKRPAEQPRTVVVETAPAVQP